MDFSKIIFRKHTTAPYKTRLTHRDNVWKYPVDRPGHRVQGGIFLGNTAKFVYPQEKKGKTCEVFCTLSATVSNPWRLGLRSLQGRSAHFWDQPCSSSNSNDDVSFVEGKDEDIKEWSWILGSARALIGRCSIVFGRYAKSGVSGSWKAVSKKTLVYPICHVHLLKFSPRKHSLLSKSFLRRRLQISSWRLRFGKEASSPINLDTFVRTEDRDSHFSLVNVFEQKSKEHMWTQQVVFGIPLKGCSMKMK